MSVIDKAALLRWESESKSEPVAAPKRDRKKYTPRAVTIRVQRDEAQRVARVEREAAVKARAEKLAARVRNEIPVCQFDTP